MEIEEKGSINDLEQKFAFGGLYKYYQIETLGTASTCRKRQ